LIVAAAVDHGGYRLDALTQAIESHSSTWRNDFSDALCVHAVKLICEYLPRAYADGTDREAREHMHNAATIGGIGFGNSQATLAHAMGHAFGALFHIPHGRSVALFLPYTMEFAANSKTDRYVEIARALGLPVGDGREGPSTITTIRELEAAPSTAIRARTGYLARPTPRPCGSNRQADGY
jgi:alcohol dehydrogenase class IV